MAIARTGSATAFWDGTTTFNQSTNPGGGASVTLGGTSKKVYLARFAENICFYLTSSAAATISVLVAHHGALTAEGNEPDESSPPADNTFMALTYNGSAVAFTFGSSGSQALLVPFFTPAWVRLKTSAAATLTAGYELISEA